MTHLSGARCDSKWRLLTGVKHFVKRDTKWMHLSVIATLPPSSVSQEKYFRNHALSAFASLPSITAQNVPLQPFSAYRLSDDTAVVPACLALSVVSGASPSRRRTNGSEYSSSAGVALGKAGKATVFPGQLRPVASTAF